MAPTAPPTEEGRPTYSGRLLLRMPPELHAELARHAERKRVSLNHFITGAVAGAVGWTTDRPASPGSVEAERPAPLTSPRAIRTALLVNLVVVTIAGAGAIALLVLAWARL